MAKRKTRKRIYLVHDDDLKVLERTIAAGAAVGQKLSNSKLVRFALRTADFSDISRIRKVAA